jgi:DNA-binding LacI/PurR family transcriptional regulator
MPTIKIEKDAGPLYAGLTRGLRRFILDQGFQEGQRFPSHREISEMASVSRVTARLATKQLEREGILESRGGQGTFIRQIPIGFQAEDRAPINRQVGVVLSMWDNVGALSWDDARMMPGLLEEAAEHNIAIQLIPHELATGDPEKFDRYVQDRHLTGLIWLCMRYPGAVPAARWAERGLPQISVQSRMAGVRIPIVSEDNVGAATCAIKILLGEGHRRVLVFHGDPAISTYTQRLAGVREELQRQGIDLPVDWFVKVPTEWPYPKWVSLYLREVLERVKPTAVLMLGELTSELVEAGKPLGMEFGDNCRLVSFHPSLVVEGVRPAAYTYFWPNLREIGRKAISLWLRTQREVEQTKGFHPDWMETIEMEIKEYPLMETEREAGVKVAHASSV